MKLLLRMLEYSILTSVVLSAGLAALAITHPAPKVPVFPAVIVSAVEEAQKREWAEATEAAKLATEAREAARKETRKRIDVARVVVAFMMREPGSTKFGQIFGGRDNAVCGYVNARNGFGGMSGMQEFVHLEGGMPIVGHLAIPRWNRYCAGLTAALH